MIIKDINLLRKVSSTVVDQSEADSIILKLEEELTNGVGLSAPQIGIYKQVAIIRCYECIFNIINPIEIELSKERFIFRDEGCLSFPDERVDTIRRVNIKFKNGFDKEVVEVDKNKQSSLVTVAFQHEIGHFYGKVFKDFILKNEYKIGRNDLCLCGSGKKFKKCCMGK